MATTGYSEFRTLSKNGFNKFSQYKYVDKDTLYDYFRVYFAEERLFVLASTESTTRGQRPNKNNETMNTSLVHKKLTIVNLDNPEEKIEVYSDGVGEDKTDKDIYQGDTGAMKYFLIDNFLVSGGDSFPGDVEHDSNEKKTYKETRKEHGDNGNGKVSIFSTAPNGQMPNLSKVYGLAKEFWPSLNDAMKGTLNTLFEKGNELNESGAKTWITNINNAAR